MISGKLPELGLVHLDVALSDKGPYLLLRLRLVMMMIMVVVTKAGQAGLMEKPGRL